VPNEPTRPGKHAARHKAPARGAAVFRAPRLNPALRTLPLTRLRRVTGTDAFRTRDLLRTRGVRRGWGTVVAVSAVVLAGAGTYGGATGASPETSARHTAAMEVPAPAGGEAARERAAAAAEASRGSARESLARPELRDHPAVAPENGGGSVARAKSIVPDDPRVLARQMMAEEYGWGAGEFSCLDQLWISESDWDHTATNPTSGAYGIPQSLPANKMASAGPDWRTNPATQIEWGLEYIDLSYGTPCSAWEFKQANNWY
jgi:hypothetical protein